MPTVNRLQEKEESQDRSLPTAIREVKEVSRKRERTFIIPKEKTRSLISREVKGQFSAKRKITLRSLK